MGGEKREIDGRIPPRPENCGSRNADVSSRPRLHSATICVTPAACRPTERAGGAELASQLCVVDACASRCSLHRFRTIVDSTPVTSSAARRLLADGCGNRRRGSRLTRLWQLPSTARLSRKRRGAQSPLLLPSDSTNRLAGLHSCREAGFQTARSVARRLLDWGKSPLPTSCAPPCSPQRFSSRRSPSLSRLRPSFGARMRTD